MRYYETLEKLRMARTTLLLDPYENVLNYKLGKVMSNVQTTYVLYIVLYIL